MKARHHFQAAAIIVTAMLSPALLAQEVIYTPSATSPGEGIAMTRHSFSYESYGSGPNGTNFSFDQYTFETAIGYGITNDLSFMMHLPVVLRDFDGPGAPSNSQGIDDMRTMLKYRFFQQDVGNIDTVRMALLAGVEIPSYDDVLSSDSFDPFIGWALTAIEGRHGVGAHAMYKLNTGTDKTDLGYGGSQADAISFDGSYLYRVDPVQYTIDTTNSKYLLVEINNRYEVNGDYETLLSPGFLIEAQNWAAEVAVRLPIVQQVDNRAELDWALTFGLRLTY